jgi:hypothetical protein
MDWRIAPIAEEHIAAFHALVDSVAREKRYLLFLEGPSLEDCTAFVKAGIRQGHVRLVALAQERQGAALRHDAHPARCARGQPPGDRPL